jgi:rare lipoprotein A
VVVNLLLAGCQRSPRPNPHYVLGEPYQSGGVWWYPRENHGLDETGLAAVYPDGHPPLTTDGEVFGQGALAAAHPTLQLPVIARLTNLQTGRAILVRINDRGVPTPHRLVQLTKRTADLLGMPHDGTARIRLTVLAAASANAEEHVGGAPQLQMVAAPRGVVASAELAAPPGARQESGHALSAEPGQLADAAATTQTLPESVTQGAPFPGRLWVRLDSFQSYQYAMVEGARLAGLAAHVDPIFDGRSQSFRVMIGPLDSVIQADAVLDQAIRAGVNDARIVVE